MSDDIDTTANEGEETANGAKESLKRVVDTADGEVRDKLSNAVTVVGERSGDLRSQLETLSQRTAEAATPVLDSVENHIEDNDIDVTIHDNKIHVEGDEAGLRKVEADLRRVGQGTDVHVEYEREGGINLEIDDGEAESEEN